MLRAPGSMSGPVFSALTVAYPALKQALPCATTITAWAHSRQHQVRGAASVADAPAAAASPIVHVTVNGRAVEVPAGATLLDAAAKANVFVPTLCKHPRLPNTPGSCRVCMVEVDGGVRPSCCTPAAEGNVISTDTPEIKDGVRGTLTLLRANHPEACMSCDANCRCEFQDLITRYQVPMWPKLKEVSEDFVEHSSHWALYDQSSPAISLDLDKCIKCGRCVTTCQEVQGMNVLGWFNRGRDRHIGFVYESDMELSKCIECGQCVSVCPVGALSERTEWRQVLEALATKRKVMVVQTAPATRVAIGEEMGLAPGAVSTGQMVAGLKALGFDYVFDTDFSADLTIMEEGHELMGRLAGTRDAHGAPPVLPMFTSCCPAWVNLVEKDYPELIPHLSSCKSPQQMMGAVVKEVWAQRLGLQPEDVVLVSIMPCTAKKHEAERPEMFSPARTTPGAGEGAAGAATEDGGAAPPARAPHVDFVLTTRELGRLFRHQKVPMASLPSSEYDNPMGVGSGAGVIFGNSGGVMEAAVRTVYEVATGKELPRLQLDAVRGLQGVKEATLELPIGEGGAPRPLRLAVVSGIAHARALLQRMREGSAPEYDFVEVMSCPGGCIGGGGQPKSKDPLILTKRMKAIYAIDEDLPLRKSHDNPQIQDLYRESLGKPNGPRAHELLHTHYADRSARVTPSYTEASKQAAAVPDDVAAALHAPSPRDPGPQWRVPGDGRP